MSFRAQMRYMNPYDIHKALINEYILNRPGDTTLLRRDTSKDRTDADVVRTNHKFLWGDETPDTWEEQFAKKYYDKLFKEYCISDLTLYKENKVALRWRTEQEVVIGKGQFICGNKKCTCEIDLKTWEVNFAYKEKNEKKNALVKIRLCPDCSQKLNYHSKKREIKRAKHKRLGHTKKHKKIDDVPPCTEMKDSAIEESKIDSNGPSSSSTASEIDSSPWQNIKPVESKSRDEEMDEYLEELLL